MSGRSGDGTDTFVGVAALVLGSALVAGDCLAALVPQAGPVAHALRVAFAPTCHQLPQRSFALGAPLATCARCCGLHASGVVGGALVLALRGWVRPRAAGAWLAGIAAAVVLDVAAGTLVPAWDHAGVRALTGLAAGAAILVAGTGPSAPATDRRRRRG